MWVYLPWENWATQWPAPSGFHVPLSTERQAVYNIWTALGGGSSDWTNFWIALKLPFAGYRSYSYAGVNNQGSDANYWSSTPGDSYFAYRLYFKSSNINRKGTSYRSNANSVRCFKDSPTVPTSSWTKLYWTSIEAGWIFWSSADWLISLSSDGSNWITIADKNLWATTVWNSWDTLSEANCGKYYQRWNNYGFPRTWSVTTSSAQVDASNYWPWNYYNSSTFITRSSSPYTWDSTDNWNLWWWETWVVTLENAITNTGVLSVNWQTWHVTVESWWKQSYFKTQDEYDALPASKESDGNLYIIVDTHINFMPFTELTQLTPSPDAILAELNKAPKDYAEYYYENGDIQMREMPSSQLPRADAYLKNYVFSIGNNEYDWEDTNLTEQELSNMWAPQEIIETILSWEWYSTNL